MEEQEKSFDDLQFLRFPLLGTRSDGEAFSYLLMDISQDKASIVISKWMIDHTLLNLKEKIDLFIPSLLAIEYDLRNHVSGVIKSVTKEEQIAEYLYEIAFVCPLSMQLPESRSLAKFTQNLSTETSLLNMLLRLIKDSLILKQGILVYLKHLAPYFSRIVHSSLHDYEDLNKIIFIDIANKMGKKASILESLYFSLTESLKTLHDVSIFLNLEELRELIESEISLDLFLIAFAEVTSREELVDLLNKPKQYVDYKRNNKYMTYLLAIKDLEKRLYSNYNQIVLIYLKSVITE